jgi:hypothetical protein
MILVPHQQWAEGQPRIHHMKTKIILAATPAILAIAALLLSFRSINADTLVAGYFCVAGLIAIVAMDYRFNWKRLIGR